jgi:hypothetical protein
MVERQRHETFAPMTLGHIRSHGCRDHLVYRHLRTVASLHDAQRGMVHSHLPQT